MRRLYGAFYANRRNTAKTENKCFKIMLKIFKATAIKMLKSEIQIKFINNYLNKLQTKTRLRMTINNFKQKFETTCEKIKQKLKTNKERRRQTDNISGKIKHK